MLPSRLVGSWCFVVRKFVFVVFASPCRRDLWFLVFACSVLHWNVKFPPGSEVWQPKEPCNSGKEKPVPPHTSQTIKEQHQTHCSSISKAATASAQQRRKQRQRDQRRQQQNVQQHNTAVAMAAAATTATAITAAKALAAAPRAATAVDSSSNHSSDSRCCSGQQRQRQQQQQKQREWQQRQ